MSIPGIIIWSSLAVNKIHDSDAQCSTFANLFCVGRRPGRIHDRSRYRSMLLELRGLLVI